MSDSVKMSIISGFDPKGTDQAQAAMRATAAAARQSGSAAASGAQQLDFASEKTTKSLRSAASATSGLTGALGQGTGGLATAARGASGLLAGLAGGPVGLLVAGLAALTAAWYAVKQSQAAATAEMAAGIGKIQKTRLDALVSEFRRVREEIRAGATASAALNASMARIDAVRSKLDAGRLQSEMESKMADASSPLEAKRLELDFARQIASVESAAAKTAAQYAENAARSKLASAQKEAAAAAASVAALRAEYTQNSDRAGIGKQLEAAQAEAAATSASVAAARADVTAASESLTLALEDSARAQSAIAIRQRDLERAIAASLDNARLESESSALLSEQNTLQRAVNAALSRKSAALAKADAAGALPLNQWVDQQRGKNDAQKDAAEQEMKFRENVEKIKAKQARGIRISGRDQETLDLIAQRGRINAAAEAADKKDPAVEQLHQVNTRLEEINANLKGALKTG